LEFSGCRGKIQDVGLGFNKMSNQGSSTIQNDFEEDDEFEDFETKGMRFLANSLDWAENKQSSTMDVSLWTQDWDDDVLDDEFSIQLREELTKISNGN
jgi:26 proteasome complex subunit DSS1